MLALLVVRKVLAISIKAYIFAVLYIAGECASGFGPLTDPGTPIGQNLQVLIPSLQFNDSGRITAFHLVGACGGGEPGVPPGDYVGTVQDCINILQVWRLSGGDRFSIAANFTATLSVTYNILATASVTVDEPIPFSSGDVLGFTPGPDQSGFFFAIYATSTVGKTHTYHTYDDFTPQLKIAGGNRGVSASPIISVEGRHITHHVFSYRFRVLNCWLYTILFGTVTNCKVMDTSQ